MLELRPELGAVDGVDEGVDAAAAHGEPVGEQEAEVNIVELVDRGDEQRHNEVGLEEGGGGGILGRGARRGRTSAPPPAAS